jgi:cystathionine beta-lyase
MSPKTTWQTRILDVASKAPPGFSSLATPTYRGSTTLFERAADVSEDWRPDVRPYTYGLHGTPTTLELAARMALLEGAEFGLITPGGQSAISLIYLAFCGSGDHALVPDSAYDPNTDFAAKMLGKLGIEVERYDPMIGAGIETKFRSNTRLVWCESPGSVTMEVQDVPAIAEVAHRHGALVALDNTYAAGVLFDAFEHGVDVSMQALTKYIGGHSDLLLGSVTTRSEDCYTALGAAQSLLGLAASPDDCSLALRGMQTLGVRLERIQASALAVAQWLSGREEIHRVLHPALPSCSGHSTWLRDFTGSSGVFSVLFDASFSYSQVERFIDALSLFRIGYSWGGTTSLVIPYFFLHRQFDQREGLLVRFHVGLEDSADLTADLEQAFADLQ